MIENTLENKAKFFALYLHQELCVSEKPDEGYHPFSHNEKGLFLDGILGNKIVVRRIAERVYDGHNQTRLLLKPLSSITDEDAIEVANILRWSYLSDEAKIAQVRQLIDKHLNTQTNITFIEWIEVAGYLRSRGYLVPWMGLTPDELISYGWVKYKED